MQTYNTYEAIENIKTALGDCSRRVATHVKTLQDKAIELDSIGAWLQAEMGQGQRLNLSGITWSDLLPIQTNMTCAIDRLLHIIEEQKKCLIHRDRTLKEAQERIKQLDLIHDVIAKHRGMDEDMKVNLESGLTEFEWNNSKPISENLDGLLLELFNKARAYRQVISAARDD